MIEDDKEEYFTDEMHMAIYIFPPAYSYDYEEVEEKRVSRCRVPLIPSKMKIAKTDIRKNYYGK
jgi:hypothetical protein